MSETMHSAYSRVNDDGIPLLGTCTLVVGDGTMKVNFVNGRAQVPESLCDMVSRHPNIEIPTFGGKKDDDGEPDRSEKHPEMEDTVAPKAGWTEVDAQAVELARQHLEEEGLEVPNPTPATLTESLGRAAEKTAETARQVPHGFSAQTDDGQPRCLAEKADGSQCSNAASRGDACGLGRHQDIVNGEGS